MAGWAPVAIGAAVGVAALGLAGCTGSTTPRSSDIAVSVSRGVCGTAWAAPHGGEQTFQVRNVGTVTAEVDLIDPATGAVYAEVGALAPNTSRPMRVRLGRGGYALRCLPEDTDAVTGPTVTITAGPERGSPAVSPVTEQDLTAAVTRYRSYVSAGLAALATDVGTLRAAVHAGDLAAARAAWLPAHLAYARLGAAYGTFGDFADKIDGRPDGLPAGVRDPGFTGFHRIEYGLWHGQSLASLTGPVDRLVADVAGLRKAFPSQQIDPADLPLRAHEIMENALQFEVTGGADQGSGTSLATVEANLDGTQAVLDALALVLASRYSGWQQVGSWLARTRGLLEAAHRHGGWTPPSRLDGDSRQRLDGAVGQLLEVLAPIAAIGEVRRTS